MAPLGLERTFLCAGGRKSPIPIVGFQVWGFSTVRAACGAGRASGRAGISTRHGGHLHSPQRGRKLPGSSRTEAIMIVCDVGDCWQVVLQTDHADLSGDFARRWSQKTERSGSLITAA
ncbi:MAG: DUF3891 family protein, partial [Solirubrobacterales bacterium]|nr:DUF3891 family protein [Solirubrobacterales bacterium]